MDAVARSISHGLIGGSLARIERGRHVPERPLVSFCNVSKRFPGALALDDVSMDIHPGRLHAIVGENGAGKSTLIKCLSGVITDYDGRILVDGTEIRFRGTTEAERSGISIIHQELNLVEQLSVAANIYLGREKRTRLGLLDDRAMHRSAAELLDELECGIGPDRLVGELRVGDQQLVEIAKALSLSMEILIMDEPTSALSEAEVARLFRVIDRLLRRGVTILYISHKMDEVFRLADQITVMRDGRVVDTVSRADAPPREITHKMVGREIEATDLGKGRNPGDTILEVRDLCLVRPGHAKRWLLRDVSFKLRAGEILGVAGLMGAGRTELLDCLFGSSDRQPRGRILLDGSPVRFRHPAQAMRAGVALVTEDRKRLGIFPNLNVGSNITICALREVATLGVIRFPAQRAMAQRSVKQLEVKTPGIDTPITSLSGGNQQKSIIGRWLLTDPKVLLLDDPTRGVDVGAKAELYALMDRLSRSGLGIIVTSSELPELLTLCDRILVLCEGRLRGQLSRAEATEERIMDLATLRPGVEAQAKVVANEPRPAASTE
jgi:ABC-type sugar transport system ATPase subunit